MPEASFKRLLSIQEMAHYLGIKVNTLYSWINTRRIPYIKVGRLVKFDFREIEKCLDNHKVNPWENQKMAN